MTTATVDLTVAGTGGTINGAVFTNQSTNSGTGIFNTFVQLQDKGIEQGYNSDAAPQFDESTSHKHNHSILLADVPIFIGDGTGGTVEGVVYREFRFDANEVGGAGRLLSLDKLEIWQEEFGVSPASHRPARPPLASIMPPVPGSPAPYRLPGLQPR